MYPEELQTLLPESPELICRGGSVIISPLGKILAGPLLDERGSLIAHIDLDDIVRSKLDFDPIGHYNRPDIFEFRVHGQPKTRNTDD
jgi:nitrilase